MLNFNLCSNQFVKGKLLPPKIAAQEAVNREREIDKSIIELFTKLENSVSSPILDSLAGNYTTGFFQQNKVIFVVTRRLSQSQLKYRS